MATLVPGLMVAGRYRLERLLGQGGAGAVWLAVPVAPAGAGEPVALKFIGGPAEVRERHRAAARLAQRLVHPNIVRTLEVIDAEVPGQDPWLVLVLEHVAGDTLRALRGAGFRDIVAAVLEVVEALQYAHAQGVIHRDLKPANVLRDARGHCRVTDFGLAVTGGASLSGASPQQLAGEAPAVADDLHGLGALLYDLLAGQPPLHPDITGARIRDETPAPLGVDGRGEVLPRPLVQLVSALLEKSPARRPAGMGAVRVILEDVLAERPAAAPLAATPAGPPLSFPPPGPVAPAARSRGGPGLLVVVAGLLLAAAVVAVIFYLPGFVKARGPLVVAPASLPADTGTGAAATTAPGAAPVPTPRSQADEALARYRQEDQAAQAAGLAAWAPAAVATARRAAAIGEQRYQNRDFPGAVLAFEEAAGALAGARAAGPGRLAEALARGEAALAAGNQAAAVAAFEEALTIESGHGPAEAGLARARRLPEVLAAMAAASALENTGDLAGAAREYQAALAVDPAWSPAREGLARIQGRRAAADFEGRMAQGFAALGEGRFVAAREAFNAALALRPGDAGARDALKQVALAEQGDRLAALGREAARLAASEDWAGAADRYRQMLALDSTLLEARDGLARAEARADLDRRLKAQLQAADRLNEDAVADRARSLLAEARSVETPGPVLAGQIAELTGALAIASQPVTVRFESDNLTAVTILKVGSLGTFEARAVELRPGTYTVVGTRQGYRDVRRTVRVGPGGTGAPVVLRCEEPI